MQQSTKLVYSAFSGTYLTIPEQDLLLMEVGHIPLKKQPQSSCNKCHGRGHLGRDNQSFFYYICNCVKKVMDMEQIEKGLINKIDIKNL
jgi:hypothetical protein